MRSPNRRGSAIDDARFTEWVERFVGYRQEATRERIERWIDQFHRQDRDLAARVLDCVQFVSHEAIEVCLREALHGLPGWSPNSSQRTGKWRFVPFSMTAGESGDTRLHKLRSAAGLSAARFNELFINKRDLLKQDLGLDDSVVFVDDFAGSGTQACRGWNEVMAELLPSEPNVYLILVAVNHSAKDRIVRETRMCVHSTILLGNEDNILPRTCRYFTNAEKQSLLRYCKRANRRDPRGYGECGLVIVLAHKTPNNSIPIFYVTHFRWHGLFPRPR